jgi:hypothetical protein
MILFDVDPILSRYLQVIKRVHRIGQKDRGNVWQHTNPFEGIQEKVVEIIDMNPVF